MKTIVIALISAWALVGAVCETRQSTPDDSSYRRAFNACVDADPSDAGICNCIDSLGQPEDMDTCLCGSVIAQEGGRK